jgi:DNA mismatch endonuclease, patch repair protein
MADNMNIEQRSYVMSRIHSKNTKPELIVRKFLFSNGYRYRLHVKNITGKPDIVLRKFNIVILVHGCFWHGHTVCKRNKTPSSNKEYWNAKILNNVKRDKQNIALLKKEGWIVHTIWECELTKKNAEKTLNKLISKLSK